MTEEDFLKRWSRRKREADAVKGVAPPKAAEPAPAAMAETAETPEFDPATLPPLESINALTDVTAFLRDGVPVELTRAALRRVWTADPAIRDFVGLSENAWDFTDPNAMPGFGPLEPGYDIKKAVAQLFGDIEKPSGQDAVTDKPAATKETRIAEATAPPDPSNAERPAEVEPATDVAAMPADEQRTSDAGFVQSSKNIASHNDAPDSDSSERKIRRQHGGALPQ